MEVLTIEHSAFQQLISKIDAMDEFICKAKSTFSQTYIIGRLHGLTMLTLINAKG